MINDAHPNEYTIERLTANNLVDVEQLHAAVYGKMPPPDFFKRKYDTTFTTVNYVGFIAYNVQRIPIGYYGVIPCFLQFNAGVILGAQSADTMTHPQHRFKGLFVELSTLTFQLCRDCKIQLIFGFPNQNSLPGAINKLGWEMTEQMECFVINTGVFSWDRVFSKLMFFKKIFAGYQHQRIKKYLLPDRGVANSVINDGFAGVLRNHDYYQYKTYAPKLVIKIGNATLWVKIGREFLIGDISLASPTDFEEMMQALKKLVGKLGISQIYFHACPGTTLYNLFSKYYKSVPSFPVLFQNFGTTVPLSQVKFTSADIDTF